MSFFTFKVAIGHRSMVPVAYHDGVRPAHAQLPNHCIGRYPHAGEIS
jgi:hypothetical protein